MASHHFFESFCALRLEEFDFILQLPKLYHSGAGFFLKNCNSFLCFFSIISAKFKEKKINCTKDEFFSSESQT